MEAEQAEKRTGPWTEDEHLRFMEGCSLFIQASKYTARTGPRLFPMCLRGLEPRLGAMLKNSSTNWSTPSNPGSSWARNRS